MALFDIFKKKRKPEKEKVEKKVEKKSEIVKPKKKVPTEAWRILESPHVTEKATGLGEKDKYLFKVLPGANKVEIKKTIEGLYGVDVLDVKIINIPQRKRRLGRSRFQRERKGYKKAIIKIKKGQKIEILSR